MESKAALETKNKKENLEKDIFAMIKSFTDETGFQITEIYPLWMGDRVSSIKIKITI